jgi:N-acetyl sugar amidotransferase
VTLVQNTAAPAAYRGRDLLREGVQICTRCIYDETVGGISFDGDGVCNYCRLVERLTADYGTGREQGRRRFAEIVARIRHAGRRRPYGVICGVSGGTDSSYVLHLAREHGLRPLAVHYDNTWNTSIATENIRKVTTALGVDLVTHVCDNKESDDIFRSFFLAGVPELDGATDIALAEVVYRAAARFGVRYVFEGHSFAAEGVSPLSTAYVDGGYIADVHRRYGTMPMKTFPNMPFWKFVYWASFKRIRRVRPLWYLEYSKPAARAFLSRTFGWQYYGGHHLENRMTAFNHSYYYPYKFGVDQRNNGLSAAVRSGVMSRDEALAEYAQAPHIEHELLAYVKKRLGFSTEEFDRIMAAPPRSYRDFRTYKRRFELLRPYFYLLMKAHLVPESFYVKYCSPNEI